MSVDEDLRRASRQPSDCGLNSRSLVRKISLLSMSVEHVLFDASASSQLFVALLADSLLATLAGAATTAGGTWSSRSVDSRCASFSGGVVVMRRRDVYASSRERCQR